MRFNRKKFLSVILWIILVASTSTAGFFATRYIVSLQQNSNKVYKSSQQQIELPKNENNPIRIIEYTTDFDQDKKPLYFFGKEGLQELSNRIKKDLQFGPEVEDLQILHINRDGALSSNVSGQYLSLTREIDLNIQQYIEGINLDIQSKINLVFPTLFHEYFHHFEAFYLNNLKTSNTYIKEEKIPDRPFSEKFLNEWKKIFNYDEENPLYLSSSNKLYPLVSEAASNKDLFYGINVPGNYLTGISPNEKYLYGATNIQLTKKDISYYYSFSELFTRKATEASYPITSHLDPKTKVPWYGFRTPTTFILNSFSSEILRNRFIELKNDLNLSKESWEKNTNLYSLDSVYGGIANFQNNKKIIFGSKENDFYNLMSSIYGYSSNISQIFIKNNIKSFLNNDKDLVIKPNRNDINFNEIKLSGFIKKSESSKFKKIFVDNDEIINNNTIEDVEKNFISIETYKPNYKYSNILVKSSPFGKIDIGLNKEYEPYVTKNYINARTIINKPLYFWIDHNENDKVELNELRPMLSSADLDSMRPISSYRNVLNSLPFVSQEQNFLFENGVLKMENWI